MTFQLVKFAAACAAFFVIAGTPALAQPACPSQDFDAFVLAFQEDAATQQAFTVRPLESVTIDGNADPEPAPVTEMLDGDKLTFPLIGNAAMQAKEGLKSETTTVGSDQELKLFVPDTGIQIRYLFRKRADGSCWELHKMANDTF